MDQHTFDNWALIKRKMEDSGNTNNHFYKRACEIVRTGKDPFSHFLNHNTNNHGT